MKTTDLNKDFCPKCGYELECATDVKGEATPSPGDLAVCMKCAAVMTFDENLRHQLYEGEIPEKVREYQHAVLMTTRTPWGDPQ